MSDRPRTGRAIAPPTETIEVVSVRLPQALKARIERIAQDEERSVSWMTRRLLEQGVSAYETTARTGTGTSG